MENWTFRILSIETFWKFSSTHFSASLLMQLKRVSLKYSIQPILRIKCFRSLTQTHVKRQEIELIIIRTFKNSKKPQNENQKNNLIPLGKSKSLIAKLNGVTLRSNLNWRNNMQSCQNVRRLLYLSAACLRID